MNDAEHGMTGLPQGFEERIELVTSDSHDADGALVLLARKQARDTNAEFSRESSDDRQDVFAL